MHALLTLVAQRIPHRHTSGDARGGGWILIAIGVAGFAYVAWDLWGQRRLPRRDVHGRVAWQVPLDMHPARLEPGSWKAWTFVLGILLTFILAGVGMLALDRMPPRRSPPPPAVTAPTRSQYSNWWQPTDVPTVAADDASATTRP